MPCLFVSSSSCTRPGTCSEASAGGGVVDISLARSHDRLSAALNALLHSHKPTHVELHRLLRKLVLFAFPAPMTSYGSCVGRENRVSCARGRYYKPSHGAEYARAHTIAAAGGHEAGARLHLLSLVGLQETVRDCLPFLWGDLFARHCCLFELAFLWRRAGQAARVACCQNSILVATERVDDDVPALTS